MTATAHQSQGGGECQVCAGLTAKLTATGAGKHQEVDRPPKWQLPGAQDPWLTDRTEVLLKDLLLLEDFSLGASIESNFPTPPKLSPVPPCQGHVT